MDTLTHALSGALLARATERGIAPLPRRIRMWVGFWAAAFPDSDFVLGFFDPFLYLTEHRGWTHSILLLPLWALGLAVAFAWIYRRKYSWRSFVMVCALGIGIHIAGDVITAFGTMIFAPLSKTRIAFPFTFIIDPYFSAIIVFGLIGTTVWRSRRIAIGAFAVLASYVGLQAWLHRHAIDLGENYALQREFPAIAVQALPQPLSPFHWMVVITEPNVYRIAYISLWGATETPPTDASGWWRRMYAAYRPMDQARWQVALRYGESRNDSTVVRQLWNSELMSAYRKFAMLPALYRIDRAGTSECIWFEDLRFLSPGRELPFRYGACRDAGEAWRAMSLADITNMTSH